MEEKEMERLVMASRGRRKAAESSMVLWSFAGGIRERREGSKKPVEWPL